jgi:subtilisin family serine protease
MRNVWRGLALAGAVTALTPAAASAKTYIVQLKAAPLATYTGGTKNLRATSPLATGAARLNVKSAASQDYLSYLKGRQDALLAGLPGATPDTLHTYRVALNGFAADLTPAQVAALRASSAVQRVVPDFKRQIQAVDPGDPSSVDAALGGSTGDSAGYLGLPHGLWNAEGGPDKAGDGVIVGVIDTGITPQHPSFADHAAGNYIGSDFGPVPARWHGVCQTGQDPKGFTCNNKLIGARYYVAGFGTQHIAAGSFLSPRDDDGHGTHTSSTAAGNFGVDPSIEGNDLGVDLISGIAPRARVAMYKACWVGGDVADGCDEGDLVDAIDDAVRDGVDVINYSIGGGRSDVYNFLDEDAFLGARSAGVFVATSAGNDGPGESTVGQPTSVPWVTSVAADNPARTFTATAHITPSNGAPFDITGASVTGPLVTPTEVVDAANSVAAGTDPQEAARCFPGSLDPAKVGGKIVLCLRGTNDRIEKSQVVKDAGGVGMILYNPSQSQDTDTDIHWVPTVHVSLSDGQKVKDAITAGTTTATIGAGHATLGTPKVLAAFSSRGPQGPNGVPDLPKPDLTAPGVNILAGNTPDPAVADFPHGQLFQSISGTSMASPHVAGAGALLKAAHPDWTPDEIKSALMMTANSSVLKEDGTTAATPFDAGTGEIDPTKAANPGLVLNETVGHYVSYVNHQLFGANGIAPSDLNLASIGNSAVVYRFTTTRTFTSVDPGTRTWTATASVPGFDVTATAGPGGPSTFSIPTGASQALTITATRTNAPLKQWAFGALTLTSGSTALRIPISLRPLPLRAPGTVSVSTAKFAGSQAFSLLTGYQGTLNAAGFGLAAPNRQPGQTVAQDADLRVDPSADSPSNRAYDVTVPAGAQLLSGRISNADGDARPQTDLDLYLYYDANKDGKFTTSEEYARLADGTADEGLTELNPPAGNYRFVVLGFATAAPTTYDWTTWLLKDPTADDLTGGPALAVTGDPFAATLGGTVQPTLQWNNVLQKGLYLGVVNYDDGTNGIGTSVVELDKTVDGSATSVGGTVGGTVPATLSLSLGSFASFGQFTPGVTNTYTTTANATVTSTAGDATLSVVDPDTVHPGRLVNGQYAMTQPLKANAKGGPFGTVSNSPLALLTYGGPVTNDVVGIGLQQPVASTDPLRTGNYAKTLTFTLSTTTP